MLFLPLMSHALAADPGTANFTSKGFTIADASGKNTLNLGVTLQPRLTFTLNGDPDTTDEDAMSDLGVRMRRALFSANGQLAGFLEYRFRIDAARGLGFTDGEDKSQLASKPILDDAQVVFKIGDPFQVSVGQWKVPFITQQVTGDPQLLFAERALTSDGMKYGDVKVSGYSYSREAGVAVQGTVAEKKFEYAAGVFNGDGTNVWPQDGGFLYLARVAVAPLGEFKYDEVDLERGKPRLAIGGGVTYNIHPQYNDEGAAGDAITDMRASGDARFAASGLSVNVEGVYGSTATGGTPVNTMGFYAQAAYCLPVGVAPGVRFAQLDPNLDSTDDGVSQIDGVVNWFLPDPSAKGKNLGHKAQIQAAWSTGLAESLDHPVFHTFTLQTSLVL